MMIQPHMAHCTERIFMNMHPYTLTDMERILRQSEKFPKNSHHSYGKKEKWIKSTQISLRKSERDVANQ